MEDRTLVSAELEALAQDLRESTYVEVYHLDDKCEPQKATYCANWGEESIRIEMRPHFVVTRHVQDDCALDGWCVETVEVPLERVLLAIASVDDEYGQPCETVERARWVKGPHGQLLRLVP